METAFKPVGGSDVAVGGANTWYTCPDKTRHQQCDVRQAAMNLHREADGWDEISDAELLGVQSAHLSSGTSETRDSSIVDKVKDNNKPFAQPRVPLSGPKRERSACRRSPMQRFGRPSLSVTDLSAQTWCEMQVVLGMELPQVARRRMECAEVKAGASIHLARELEVHEVVPVTAVTREDRMALKFLNLLAMIRVLQTGCRVRELPVFGVVDGVFLVGVIDELRYSDKGQLVLNELKTRRSPSMPSDAQFKGHCLQVGLYKLLFDAMVRGSLVKEHFIGHLKLCPERALGAGVLEYAGKLGFHSATFGELLDLLLLNLTYCELPSVDVLCLEYCYQASGEVLNNQEVPFEEERLRAEISDLLSYWMGRRQPRGVDIEDIWKCKMCPFEELCEWRADRLQGTVKSRKKSDETPGGSSSG